MPIGIIAILILNIMEQFTTTLVALLFLALAYLAECAPVSNTQKNAPLVYGIFTKECWDTLIVHRIFEFVCLKKVAIKMLGYAIVFASAIVKIPQIVNIIKAKSTKGLAELMLYTELLGYMIGMFYPIHYGQPFSTYGECVFITIQAAIVLSLLWYYNRARYPLCLVLLFVIGYSAFGVTLMYGTFLSDYAWSFLYTALSQISTLHGV